MPRPTLTERRDAVETAARVAVLGTEPVSYVIGQPVIVTVYPDGTVTFAVDLSDVGRARDIESDELTDEQIDAVAATVNTALHAGTYTIKEG